MLGKAIEHGKEHRKRYYGSKAFDRSCRNHGGCDYCEGNRKAANRRRELAAEEELRVGLSDYYHRRVGS